MPKVHIEVLGVYALPVTTALPRDQIDILYGSDLTGKARRDAERQCREQLESTVLVEVLLRGRDKRFDVADFCQPRPGVPRDSWQVAWAEAYLSLDGESLLVERWADPPTAKDFRVAFFIHFWRPRTALLSSYGELSYPPRQRMPQRLRKLVPYVPVD